MDIAKILSDHKAWLSNTSGTRADLRGADLNRAYLNRAYLSGAYLRGANLRGANLIDANLIDADLIGATGILCAGTDPRGYRFVGVRHDSGTMILAGCRWFTVAEAVAHWSTKGNRDALARVNRIAKLMTES
jgi:hypothetical protein